MEIHYIKHSLKHEIEFLLCDALLADQITAEDFQDRRENLLENDLPLGQLVKAKQSLTQEFCF